MSSSAINQSVFQAKIGSVQNQADTSSVYSNGVWSFKNSTALPSVTITDAGNVGIGTASPDSKLQIQQTISNGISIARFTGGTLNILNSQGLANTATSTRFTHNFSAGDVVTGEIGSIKADYYNTNSHYMFFNTGGVERMRLDASGNLLVGATSAIDAVKRIHGENSSDQGQYSARSTSASAGKWWKFGASSNAYIVYNQGSTGVYLVDGQTSWQANSDERLKKNIKPLELGLEQIKALKPARFDYNNDESEASARVGFIAQEVLPVLPHAVHVPEDSEKMMGVSATEMIPVLVKAIQELSAQVEELKVKLP